MSHIPVLQKEIIDGLDLKLGDQVVDGTINGGGHTRLILEKIGDQGKVLGIDLDKGLIEKLREKHQELKIKNVILVNDNFKNIDEIVKKNKFQPDAILLDLGMSSNQLEGSERGFSFLKDELLDMRFSIDQSLTAYEIINSWTKDEIKQVLKVYGEEQFANQIADEIYKQRKAGKIRTTKELGDLISRTVPTWYQDKKIDSATKTFQALRIAVNDELNNLKTVLGKITKVLKKDGRICIISFHALEDRIVKDFFKAESVNGNFKIMTKKPIEPSFLEVKQNPRSRSAKLRIAKKL